MKRMSLLLLSLLLLCGCGKSAPAPQTPVDPARSDALPEVYSQDEYMLYQNVFYGDYGAEAVGKTVEKQGAYATVYDAYNQRQRYYVWGYYDRTKCCDWQWEFVPENPDALPAPGSMIRVTGTFAASEDALDGYWIEPADCSVEGIYTGPRTAASRPTGGSPPRARCRTPTTTAPGRSPAGRTATLRTPSACTS